ncbi:RNA polymerase I-specific transcription initiation factor RRN3 [Pyronema omphalodes]|nr:RNA polymerase I-specific transcription initiation factor RRN3 [Pyronema omphalodes]
MTMKHGVENGSSTPLHAKKRVRFASGDFGVKTTKKESDPEDSDTSFITSTTTNTPSKKIKVTKPMKNVKDFVKNALDERANGKMAGYEELRRKFQASPEEFDEQSPAPSSQELQMTIKALTGVVSRLDTKCESLVECIIATNWVGRDNMFVSAYVKLLANLVSAHAHYMGNVTKMLVQNLGSISKVRMNLPGYEPVNKNTVYDRVHFALQYILDLVPTASTSTLYPLLVQCYPHQKDNKAEHILYVDNCLRIIDYVPSIRHKLLTVIISHVIKIDIEIQGDLEDLDDSVGEQLEAEIMQVDVEDDLSEDDDSDDDDEATETTDKPESEDQDAEEESEDDEDELDAEDDFGGESPEKRLKRLRESVDKLDNLLDLLFGYYAKHIPETEADKIPSREITESYENLQSTFWQTIFPTYQSRYTQFLMFWAAQRFPHFSDHFSALMVQRMIDGQAPQHTRITSTAYIASFIARAKTVKSSDVKSVVNLMCRWLGDYMNLREPECKFPDANRYRWFYQVVQAVMYIFCYRWRDLHFLDEEDEESIELHLANSRSLPWIPDLHVLKRVIGSRFNPLKVCSQAVVDTFADTAFHLQFMTCWTIIEENKRNGLGPEEHMLDCYFPFDPYTLKKSRRWIDPVYIVWQPAKPEDDDDSDEDSSDDEDDATEWPYKVDGEAEVDEDDSSETRSI